MFLETIFAPLAAHLTIDTLPNNHTAIISAHGNIALVEAEVANDFCEIPTQGTCALNAVAAHKFCLNMRRSGCPDWESIALAGNCILPNANRVCCDQVPEACLKDWMVRVGHYEGFCSNDADCLRPSCRQREYYVDSQYPNLDVNRPEVYSYMQDCFFATSSRPPCSDTDAYFGQDRLNIASALLQRAETTDATAATTADQTTEEKTDNSVAEGSTVDTGVDTNMPITLDQQWEADQQHAGGSCGNVIERHGVCVDTILRKSGTDKSDCPACLEADDSPVPDCSSGTMRTHELRYCFCKSIAQ